MNLDLGDNLTASHLVLNLTDPQYYLKKAKNLKVDLDKFSDGEKKEVVKMVISNFTGEYKPKVVDADILELSHIYILYKLISICEKYEEYKKEEYFDFQEKEFNNLTGLVLRLKEDNSHITFKLRQVINYLVLQHIPFKKSKEENKLSLEKLAVGINKRSKTENLINLLPPPIFRSDVELRSKKANKENIKFSLLSSGEKQQIFSINSIFYHLVNLDSVHKGTDPGKTSYRDINIILEEIELYFHPEFQRTYIARGF